MFNIGDDASLSIPLDDDIFDLFWGILLDDLGSIDLYLSEELARTSFSISGGISLVTVTTRKVK